MPDLSHLTEHVAEQPEESTLETLMAYGEMLVQRREEAAEIETTLKEKKKEILRLEQELLPELMIELGLTGFTLKSGQQINIQEELSVTVKNYELLYDFLEERGDDSLMTTAIEFGKLPQSILNKVIRDLKEKYDIEGTSKLAMHPQTLKAYFKRLCGVGGEDQAQVPLAAINEEMLSTYTYYKVRVKK